MKKVNGACNEEKEQNKVEEKKCCAIFAMLHFHDYLLKIES